MKEVAKELAQSEGLFEVISKWTDVVGVFGLLIGLTISAVFMILAYKSPDLVSAFSKRSDQKKKTDSLVAGRNASLSRQQFEFEKKHNLNKEGDKK